MTHSPPKLTYHHNIRLCLPGAQDKLSPLLFNSDDDSTPSFAQTRLTQRLPYELRVLAHLNFTQFRVLLGIKDRDYSIFAGVWSGS